MGGYNYVPAGSNVAGTNGMGGYQNAHAAAVSSPVGQGQMPFLARGATPGTATVGFTLTV